MRRLDTIESSHLDLHCLQRYLYWSIRCRGDERVIGKDLTVLFCLFAKLHKSMKIYWPFRIFEFPISAYFPTNVMVNKHSSVYFIFYIGLSRILKTVDTFHFSCSLNEGYHPCINSTHFGQALLGCIELTATFVVTRKTKANFPFSYFSFRWREANIPKLFSSCLLTQQKWRHMRIKFIYAYL